MSDLIHRIRPCLSVVLTCAIAFAAASYLRFRLIEPADVGPQCVASAQAKMNVWACTTRELTIQAFSANRLAWVSLLLGVSALLFTQTRILALLALAHSSAGLVLYSVVWCAPAFWLSLLAFQRAQSARHT